MVLQSRRSVVWAAVVAPLIAMGSPAAVAVDDSTTPTTTPSTSTTTIPMITMNQFLTTVLRDSASSIRCIEFSGPQSETVRIILQDDSVFGIADVVESPTDPRSPLKLAAAAKANGIPVRFLNLEAVLLSSRSQQPKAIYTNERVQAAAVKELEKARRMQADEELRLMELERMNQQSSQ
jgi:hypothetical protein